MIMDRVAYKPLGTSPPNGIDDYEEAECELDEALASCGNSSHTNRNYKYYGVYLNNNIMAHVGLRQLRILLYLVAAILFLIFIIQLSTNSARETRHLSSGATIRSIQQQQSNTAGEQSAFSFSSSSHLLSASSKLPPSTNANSASSPDYSLAPRASGDSRLPEYESYLSSVLHERNSQGGGQNAAAKESIDDLHIPNDEYNTITTNDNRSALLLPLVPSPIKHSASAAPWWNLNHRYEYVTVSNYIRAMKSFSHNSSITLTTQATTEFMYHTLELCKRWDGPISVAVFCPGLEMQVAISLIKFMRQCLPSPLSACIRDKVTWHMVYNKAHGPPPDAISYPKHHLDSQHFPLFVHQDQCPKFAGPEPGDSIRQFEEELRRANQILPKSYRQQFQLPYPINVLRNTARLAANTKYLLASDIELYPNINLVPSFVNLISDKHNNIGEQYNIKRFVFTLPIFEVKPNVTAPKTKSELVKLVSNGDAVFFHKYVCDACQNFPNRLDWLGTDKQGEEENYHSNDNEMTIFELTRRDKTRDSWEPIFIGTNDDPLYDDRLTWDGRRDKMAQMYEMCLRDYYLLVLGNAFLVHAPGIKHIDNKDTIKRLKYIRENNSIYDATIARLKKQFATSGNIDKC